MAVIASARTRALQSKEVLKLPLDEALTGPALPSDVDQQSETAQKAFLSLFVLVPLGMPDTRRRSRWFPKPWSTLWRDCVRSASAEIQLAHGPSVQVARFRSRTS